jgi:hypothetical protein
LASVTDRNNAENLSRSTQDVLACARHAAPAYGKRPRLPCREDAYSLNLYLFTSWVQGEALVKFFWGTAAMTDNSKRTGAAIEAHYQFLAWLSRKSRA